MDGSGGASTSSSVSSADSSSSGAGGFTSHHSDASHLSDASHHGDSGRHGDASSHRSADVAAEAPASAGNGGGHSVDLDAYVASDKQGSDAPVKGGDAPRSGDEPTPYGGHGYGYDVDPHLEPVLVFEPDHITGHAKGHGPDRQDHKAAEHPHHGHKNTEHPHSHHPGGHHGQHHGHDTQSQHHGDHHNGHHQGHDSQQHKESDSPNHGGNTTGPQGHAGETHPGHSPDPHADGTPQAGGQESPSPTTETAGGGDHRAADGTEPAAGGQESPSPTTETAGDGDHQAGTGDTAADLAHDFNEAREQAADAVAGLQSDFATQQVEFARSEAANEHNPADVRAAYEVLAVVGKPAEILEKEVVNPLLRAPGDAIKAEKDAALAVKHASEGDYREAARDALRADTEAKEATQAISVILPPEVMAGAAGKSALKEAEAAEKAAIKAAEAVSPEAKAAFLQALEAGERALAVIDKSNTPVVLRELSPEAVQALVAKYGAGVAHALEQKGTIASHAALSKATEGISHAYQAHHLVEQKVLGQLGYPADIAPAVVLTTAEHQAISVALEREIPAVDLADMTKKEILAGYLNAYANHPHWMAEVSRYFH